MLPVIESLSLCAQPRRAIKGDLMKRQKLCLLLVHMFVIAVYTMPAEAQPDAPASGGVCGPAPVCAEPPKCELRDVEDRRDKRNCKKKLIFGLQILDTVCEADKAAANQANEFTRAAAQQEFLQCLVAQESHRVSCAVRQSEWENCIARELPQFPPRSLADRKFLYERCIRAEGKDEFTEDCCTHLYISDRSTMGVCINRNPQRK